MKQLIIDAFTKAAFSFNNRNYRQFDGAFMWSPLWPVLANNMVKLENTIVKDLFDKSLIKLYMRYIDDALLLVKEQNRELNKYMELLIPLIKILNSQFVVSKMVKYICWYSN